MQRLESRKVYNPNAQETIGKNLSLGLACPREGDYLKEEKRKDRGIK